MKSSRGLSPHSNTDVLIRALIIVQNSGHVQIVCTMAGSGIPCASIQSHSQTTPYTVSFPDCPIYSFIPRLLPYSLIPRLSHIQSHSQTVPIQSHSQTVPIQSHSQTVPIQSHSQTHIQSFPDYPIYSLIPRLPPYTRPLPYHLIPRLPPYSLIPILLPYSLPLPPHLKTVAIHYQVKKNHVVYRSGNQANLHSVVCL